jgi:predicted naringenin-chalcone synthase
MQPNGEARLIRPATGSDENTGDLRVETKMDECFMTYSSLGRSPSPSPAPSPAFINRISTVVPDHDIHETFIVFAEQFLSERRDKLLFRRMAQRAGISHRYSYFEPREDQRLGDAGGFYGIDGSPGTAARMALFEEWGVRLGRKAVEGLALRADEAPTHLVVASCTGFCAPGIDQLLMEALDLDRGIERTMIGYMGCSAAVNALRTAHHIVRSEPGAKVLVVNLELCTLHLQNTDHLETILSAMLFGDGASAALVSARREGVALRDFRALTLPGTQDLITWRIGDTGFLMGLSGEVPAQIAAALAQELARNDAGGILRGTRPADYDLWAVHAGGRTVLDAVEQGFDLGPDALACSRSVLRDHGNMSSATIMFVLQRMMASAPASAANGIGMAFGPGMVAETFRFELAA